MPPRVRKKSEAIPRPKFSRADLDEAVLLKEYCFITMFNAVAATEMEVPKTKLFNFDAPLKSLGKKKKKMGRGNNSKGNDSYPVLPDVEMARKTRAVDATSNAEAKHAALATTR